MVDADKRLVLDSVGCLMGGFASAPAAAARAVAEALGGRPQATVFGCGLRTSAALATLANGTALRYLDYNDAYGGRDAAHPSGSLPAAFAVAEARRRSGPDLIAALVAAYEVQIRLCDSAGEPSLKERGWHHTCNLQFAATAAAARLIGGDPEITAQALAISATHQNTLAQIQHGRIAMIKATADAWVAKGAVEAALLAEQGLTGPDEIFEGASGWTAAVAGAVDYGRLLRPLDGAFGILEARIKPFAAVGPAQAPIQAAVEIYARHRPAAEDVEEVIVGLPRRIVEDPAVSGEEKRFPKNRETADHSYPYCVAVALLEGDCGEAQYAPDRLASPRIRRLLERTRLEADPEYSEPRSGGGVRLTLRDGTVHEIRLPFAPGSAGNPLSDLQAEAKFHRQMAVSFPEPDAAAIKETILGLENCARIGDLAAMLARP